MPGGTLENIRRALELDRGLRSERALESEENKTILVPLLSVILSVIAFFVLSSLNDLIKRNQDSQNEEDTPQGITHAVELTGTTASEQLPVAEVVSIESLTRVVNQVLPSSITIASDVHTGENTSQLTEDQSVEIQSVESQSIETQPVASQPDLSQFEPPSIVSNQVFGDEIRGLGERHSIFSSQGTQQTTNRNPSRR